MTLAATTPALIVDHAEPPPGTWERETSHYPAPLSPFAKSLFLMEHWARQITTETGSLIETIRFIEIGGWVYTRAVPFGERRGAPTPPAWMVPLLMRSVPSLRRRVATARSALDRDWSGQQIDIWYRRRDDLAGQLTTLRRLALPGLTDNALDAHVRSVITLAHECLDLHFRLHTAMAHDLRAFTVTCRELFGWDDEQSLPMLAGTSTASTEAAGALSELAQLANRSDEPRRLVLTAPIDHVLQSDNEFARGFRTAFNAYLDRYCVRALTNDVTDPILAERPELVLNLVRDQVAAADRLDQLGDGSSAIDQARGRLTGAPAEARARFEDRLTRALRAYPVREDNAYLTVCAPIALLRMVGLELGRRLVERDRIGTVEDVFLLYVDEARSALLEQTDVQGLVDRRRQERLRTLANPGPQRYGPEPALPPVNRLPPPARESTEDVLWLLDLVMPVPTPIQDTPRAAIADKVIAGRAAARGTARGPVRIVRDESEFDKLRAGDVLVCECTSPAWSIIFPSLCAVVTDSGGLLSHPAIVAREFGIPAVVATGDATTRLRDGQFVIVDGSAGTVQVVGSVTADNDAVPLAAALDAGLFGGKAANLARAMRAGLPVPDGLVLPPTAIRAVVNGGALTDLLARVSSWPDLLAVRSSAICEDGAAASFAGQHVTRLGVRATKGALRAAIAAVAASVNSPRARAYRQAVGSDRAGVTGLAAPVAVLIQPLVEADVSGAMFTRDPVTGVDELVVEAVLGLGEAVVGGQVTPELCRMAPRERSGSGDREDGRLPWSRPPPVGHRNFRWTPRDRPGASTISFWRL